MSYGPYFMYRASQQSMRTEVVFRKLIVSILSLGMDSLMLSISLGFIKVKSKAKFAMVFACSEAAMLLVGF